MISISIYLLFYITFNSQGHIQTGSLQVEETSAYCTVNHWALASNYQLSNMKRPARDLNRRPQRLEARTLTATPPSPPVVMMNISCKFDISTHNAFCSGGVTNILAERRKMPVEAILILRMRPKIFQAKFCGYEYILQI